MAINPLKLRPTEVARLINATPLGFVIGQAKVYRDFNLAGYRIASADDSRCINLLKYIAWMIDQRANQPTETARSYDDRREAERARQAAQSVAGRDIGDLPAVENPDLKEACRTNFKLFCEEYFPEVYSLTWSDDHLKAISKIETAVLHGGLFALAMPRGSGKALALDTPLPTPRGWTTMGDVRIGDVLFDNRGAPCRVLVKSPVFTDHDCYRITFSDGESIVADSGHLWQVIDSSCQSQTLVQKTFWLAENLMHNGEPRFSVPAITRPDGTECASRAIVSMEKVASVPTQCVMVDSPTHMFLAGKRMVPTHNSTLSESAAIWAMLYGHREFVVLVGATESAALEMIDSIKTELEVNEHLAADFPEVTYPIQCLDGISNRCAGQLYKGERTRITWTANEIVLPTIAGAASSGIVVRVAGITGRVRGMKFKKPDGRTVRPSLVIIDDPQTSESAGSLEQTRKRVRVLSGDILGLAGPGQKISGIMPCTIIRPGDMAEQILSKQRHPEWNGERTQLIYSFPTNEKLWEKYADLRAEGLRNEGTFAKATEFYAAHQAEMDAGARVAWPSRYNHDELSAIQHAMNLKLQDEIAFWSEYQNEPLPEDLGTDEQLTIDGIVHKLNGYAKQSVPISCNHLTLFIDIQKTLLYYVLCAWEDDFTGYVIDYGSYPDQKRRHFSLSDANPTLQQTFPRAGLEGCLYAGLDRLTQLYLTREFRRDDGASLRIERCLIDANWGASTDVVYQFCRESPHASILLPCHGRYIGASSQPMSDYRKSPGDRVGHNWRIPNVAGKRAIRHVLFDSNYWKTFIRARFLTAQGDRGSVSLWGRDPERHLLFAEHLTAEYCIKTEGRGRTVDEWKLRPEAHDNHWLDGIVGCAVAASMCGSVLPGTDNPKANTRPRVKLSELREKKHPHFASNT